MNIDQRTRLYGVVGHPIGHSLGPTMHNAALAASGLNAVYLAFDIQDVEGLVRGMRAFGIRGLSVTIPHKSTVIPLLDQVDELAQEIGAVNTIRNEEDRLNGYNTDAKGALMALEAKTEISGKRCLIVGAGGAARAIGFMLREKGVPLQIANRSRERGEALAQDLGCSFVPLTEVEQTRADLLINTTSVGMSPHTEESPVPDRILREGTTVMDIVYNPLETRLLKTAKERGCVTVDGLGMFVHQGAEQFRLWTGLEAPIEAMSQAVRKVLHGGSS
jgi:shikimate dehydrogenase